MFPDYGEGSCINCGFLAHTNSADGSEANLVPSRIRAAERDIAGWLYCFVHAADLMDEFGDVTRSGGRPHYSPDDLRRVVHAGRNCPSWYPWRPGFDARWHYEEQRLDRMERSRREFEQELERSRQEFENEAERFRRAWETRQESERQKLDEARDEESKEFQEDLFRRSQQTQRIMVAIAVVQAMLAAVALALALWLSDRPVRVEMPTVVPAEAPTPTATP